MHGSSVRHGFARIDHQRIHDLLDLRRVHLRLPEICRDVHIRAQIRSVERKLRRLLEQLRRSRRLSSSGAPPLEKVSSWLERCAACCAAWPAFERNESKLLAIVRRFDLREADVSGDDRQNVIQVVRDPAGERA